MFSKRKIEKIKKKQTTNINKILNTKTNVNQQRKQQ